jgi:hypothetical protein
MPETDEIVVNTGPIIALVAALGDLTRIKRFANLSSHAGAF